MGPSAALLTELCLPFLNPVVVVAAGSTLDVSAAIDQISLDWLSMICTPS